MTGERLATIDLGTNTFHLLIVEKTADGNFDRVYKERQFVHLGEGGVGHIREAAMQRGWATLSHFAAMLQRYKVKKYRAIGTSALREADNAAAFIEKVEQMGLHIEVIDGLEEARLIHRGVQEATGMLDNRQLIIDIGGGSVEMILSTRGKMEWAASLPLGVAVLFSKSKGIDPLTPKIIRELTEYIESELAPLKAQMEIRPPTILVGASGSFEVLEAFEPDAEQIHKCRILSRENFYVLYDEIITSTLEERQAMPAIPETRAQLIVVAMLLIKVVLDNVPFESWLFSPYALKEGVIAELS